MSLPLLGANGRMLVGETLQNVEPLRRQNTFASFGPAPNSKDNKLPISGGGVFSNTWIDRNLRRSPVRAYELRQRLPSRVLKPSPTTDREPGINGDSAKRNVHRRYRWRITGSRFTGPTRRSICLPRQQATIPRKTARTPGHLRASRSRNRRERQDQGDMVCRSRIGDRRSFRAARRERL
jgi:hypothetical protein